MVRPSAEHGLETKPGLPGADAPVEVFEREEIRFVQQADSFEGSAVEHEDRAGERRNRNDACFVARELSVAFKSHATPAQIDAHAS
jgi:hypothetical protein